MRSYPSASIRRARMFWLSHTHARSHVRRSYDREVGKFVDAELIGRRGERSVHGIWKSRATTQRWSKCRDRGKVIDVLLQHVLEKEDPNVKADRDPAAVV